MTSDWRRLTGLRRAVALIGGSVMILLPIAAAPMPAAGQSITGRVIDRHVSRPVPAALVSAVDSAGRVAFMSETNSEGLFFLSIGAPGTFLLRVEALGYRESFSKPVPLGERDTFLELSLDPSPVDLGALSVEVELQRPRLRRLGFYERRRRGFGIQLGPEDIRPNQTVTPGEIFRRSPGVAVNQNGEPYSLRAMSLGGGARCMPAVVVDNVLVRRGGEALPDDNRTGFLGGADVAAFGRVAPPAFEIEAAEFYHSTVGAPPEWAGLRNTCGIILIWTKIGS